MTRYCLPANAKTMTALELVEFEQGAQGMVPPLPAPSVAAVALASWLLADLRRTMRHARSAGSVLSMGASISRLLAGEIMPSDQLADALARLTDGAVRPEDWDRSFAIKAETRAAGQSSDAGPAADRIAQAAASGLDLIYATDPASFAVLGETPAGPLFGVLKPSRICPFYEVHGLGLSFRLSESAAQALHASLAVALGAAIGRQQAAA